MLVSMHSVIGHKLCLNGGWWPLFTCALCVQARKATSYLNYTKKPYVQLEFYFFLLKLQCLRCGKITVVSETGVLGYNAIYFLYPQSSALR